MMRNLMALAAATTLFATAALAQDSRYRVLDAKDFYGVWGASMTFDTETNQLNCVSNTEWGDGSTMRIKKFTGQDAYVELTAPYWTLRPGMSVEVGFVLDGRRYAYPAETFKYDHNDTFGLIVRTDAEFVERFGRARSGTIQFPNSREGNWPLDVKGTAAMLAYLTECAALQLEMEDAAGEPDGAVGDPFSSTNDPFSNL